VGTGPDLSLVLETEQWLTVVVDEIRHGRNSVRGLHRAMLRATTESETTEAVQKVPSSAIQLDSNLEHVQLQMENG
jgi:hypothetical protein